MRFGLFVRFGIVSLVLFFGGAQARANHYPKDVLPKIIREDAPPSRALFNSAIRPRFPRVLRVFAQSEVKVLVQQGPLKNRINLTIVGDGYTDVEKEKFFADANRTVQELFGATTFKSYLSLFNVFAVFVASHESGITDLVHKDTALGLYRDPPGSKRAIMPGNPRAIDAAIGLAPATDFPILLANDDFYGGLGGAYAITTRSLESGAMVLRHELGHNFGAVGEEYDAGYVYTGANNSPSHHVSWPQWLSGPVQGNEAQFLNGAYLWAKMGPEPIHVDFNFPNPSGQGPFHFSTIISGVGWATPDDVRILLDGNRVDYRGVFTKDRSFFSLNLNQTLAPGNHRLDFQENIPGDHVLAFAELFALAANYDPTPNHIDAYATFYDNGREAGYRPTHDSCLMRDMRSKEFCAIDKENMWSRFLNRISLIDQIAISPTKDVELKTPNLAGLETAWFRLNSNGSATELPELRNLHQWHAAQAPLGRYKVMVRFRTSEVRVYTKRFDAEASFELR